MSGEKQIVRGVLLGESALSDVVVEDGKVALVRPAGDGPATVGGRDTIIAPTLFDIQINGAFGINLQGSDVTPEDFATLNAKLAEHGVSRWIPTLITGSRSDMAHGCAVFAEALQDATLARAMPGIHLEGPYISPEDGPRGAHSLQHVRTPDLAEFDEWLNAAAGRIAYFTVAPEVEGVVEFIPRAVERGVVVSLGHHHADAEAIRRAVDAGARLSTHLGNGAKPQMGRHHNPLWPQLADDRLVASIIADLHHLPVPVLKTFVRAKTPGRVVLTSDCVHIAGLEPGQYDLMGTPAELTPTGRIVVPGTELLAGSALMLLQGVVNAAHYTDMTLEQAFASATTVPANLLGLQDPPALPKPGAPADFLAMTIEPGQGDAGPAGTLQAVFIDGERKV